MEALEILRNEKATLSAQVEQLVKLKKKLYSNMDIESPMSVEEKELNAKIAGLFSEINKVVKEINKCKRK